MKRLFKNGLQMMLLLALSLTLGFTLWTNPAKAGTKSCPEKISLNTWYISDMTPSTGSDYFTFKTSSGTASRYLVITQCLDTAGYDFCDIYPSLPKESGYPNPVYDELLKLPASKTITLKFTNEPDYWDDYEGDDEDESEDDFSDEESAGMLEKSEDSFRLARSNRVSSKIRYKFMVFEMKSDSNKGNLISAARTKSTAKKLTLNKWYTGNLHGTKDRSAEKQYLKFTASTRTGSKYVALFKAFNKKTFIYASSPDSYIGHKMATATCDSKTGKVYGVCFPLFIAPKAGALTRVTVYNEYFGKTNSALDMEALGDWESNYGVMIMEMPDMPSKESISSLTKGSRRFTVKYAKRSQATRYQIAYKRSTASSWNYITTTSTSKTISGLTSGKTYKVKVRAQRKFNDRYHCGQWSAVKSIKVK